MYIYDHNPNLSLAAWYFDKMTQADWLLHFKHLEDISTWSAKTGIRPAALMIPKGFDMPPTDLRTRLTELTSKPGYDPYVAFVAPNKAVQTVLTLFSWFQRKPQYETTFVASPAAGLEWLEQKRGSKLPVLQTMLDEVLRKSGSTPEPSTGT